MQAAALTPVDVSSIKSTIKPFTTATVKRDWNAFLALCTDDVVLLPPNQALVAGADKVRAWLEKYPVIKRFDSEFDHVEGQDHLAIAYGHYSMSLVVEGKPMEDSGKFIDTFRRDDHGKWLYACIIWNANQPVTGK